MDIILIHIGFSVGLFFIINWIGAHSYSIGYTEISLFANTDEALALNFAIRVLSPIIYIIIVSALLYKFKLDRLVDRIYLVNIYYLSFRLLFNLLRGRGVLLNWPRQILYWLCITTASYFTFSKIIVIKSNLLPDFNSIANELWIIIGIFIFQMLNTIRLSNNSSGKRKNKYLFAKFNLFRHKYGKTINEIAGNEKLEALSYAILIYENFNRPRLYRWAENVSFKITKKPHTLGVMQVKTSKYISDSESVFLGVTKIKLEYEKIVKEMTGRPSQFENEQSITAKIISNYNGGNAYYWEITQLTQTLTQKFYANTPDLLVNRNS